MRTVEVTLRGLIGWCKTPSSRVNHVKTWTEYVYRLIGVPIGGPIIATGACAFPLRRPDPLAFYLSAAVLLPVSFQGWLGAALVASHLKPVMITAHRVMAVLIVCLLLRPCGDPVVPRASPTRD